MREKIHFTISGVALLLLLGNFKLIATASNFDCTGLTVEACKAEFGSHFQDSFKALHLASLKRILSTHIAAYEEILGKLSADSSFKLLVQEKLAELRNELRDLTTESQDISRLYKTVNTVLPSLAINTSLARETEEAKENFENLIQKYNLDGSVEKRIFKFMLDIGNVWIDLYKRLRPTDFEAFPVYTEFDEYMRELSRDAEAPGKIYVLAIVRGKIAQFFNLAYLENINGAF